MNKEEYANYDYQTTTIPLIKNNSVKKCCICNNEKTGEFISIKDKKYHLCCIEQLQNNWNNLKEWLQERKFVYNITGEDLDEDTSITKVLVKMCEIESRKQ